MTAQALNRIKITVSLSPKALKLLDAECERRGWSRPQTLDEIILSYFNDYQRLKSSRNQLEKAIIKKFKIDT